MMKKTQIIVLSLSVLVLAFQNCGQSADVSAENIKSESSADWALKLGSIDLEIVDHIKLDCIEDSQCQQIAYGNKLCGGPEKWLVYSSSVTDKDYLEALVDEHKEMTKAYREAWHQENPDNAMVGTCEYRTEYSQLSCIASKCQAQ